MYFAQDNPLLSVSESMDMLVQNYKANQQQNMANQQQNMANQANPARQQFLQQQQLQQHQMQQQQLQQQAQAQMNLPPGAAGHPAMHQMQQGNRTPNTPGMQGQFMSPAMQHSLLPGNQVNGSPHNGQNPMMNPNLQGNAHTPSPAQSHMAPPMVPQQSQQGSASGTSTGTSPNISNKRRRSTQIGVKEEEAGVQANGAQPGAPKVKQSPRMASAAKRLKGS